PHRVAIRFGHLARAIGEMRNAWTVALPVGLLALAAVPLPRATSAIDATAPSSGFVQMLHTVQRKAAPFPYGAGSRAGSRDFLARSPGAPSASSTTDERPPSRRIGDRWLSMRADHAGLPARGRSRLERLFSQGAAGRSAEPWRGIDLTGAITPARESGALVG